ncbi:protein transport protein Sec16A isoform X9 [Canis lupus familiaris]|uniref:protein transport protein Sec16A isoform X9 n=1 Tax=Canis lupus familiaris TaxID=9615 RepID=UPI0018F2F519|nr:protein transport protein Sec16A isoform X9 [Canis lupus familiaris]XP_038533914.1 protein transport protein Sec16A isoform X9 [Canis lupus familiaris]
MQPPPQAAPSGVIGPPPAGTPQSMFWSNRPYRRQANNNTPVTPITCPLQPVTDPFAFSRQALQSTSLGSSSKSSLPILQGPAPAAFPQRPGLPVPHTNAGDTPQGPVSQPRADGGLFSSVLTPSAPLESELNRSADGAPSSEPEVQTLSCPQYIPGVGPDGSHGGHPPINLPGPDRPLSTQNLHDGAPALAPPPFIPQPHQPTPGQWGPGQSSPQPSGQHYWPRPEGSVQNAVPHASSVPHFPAPSNPHHGPGHEQLNPLMPLPGPLASDGSTEAAYLQSGNHSTSNFDPENAFRQNSQAGNTRVSQELRPSPGVNKEQLPDLALINPLTQGNSPESHLHYPLGAGTSRALPEVDSGALSMFFQGGETENEENLSSEKTGSAGQCDFDGFSPSPALGHAPAHMGAGSIYQAFPKGSSSEATQPGGHPQPYFSQSAGAQPDRPTTANAAITLWGSTANAGTHAASSSQSENVEDLEFIQNQEVLPSEPLSLDPSTPSDQVRYGPLPRPAIPRLGVVGLAGGGGPNLEAPDSAPHPVRSDSVSSSYSSKSHRNPSSAARPQELVGTFIQQEVGKPEDESSGSFFKQIDSSPVGGETNGTTMSQNHHSSLSQPSTPSPPKPTGIFQTSANSSFEPVKSHLVGVKPVEADRANVVGEVRGTAAYQKQRRPTAAPPDTSPGNLEQPPDNIETLFTLQACSPPFTVPVEAGPGLVHTTGPPLETVLLAAEKRPLARAQGAVKCESPVTTLWAQNELPDFGGNVLLAPAAPALHVPVKPQPSEVIQPPDEGVSAPQARQPGSGLPLQSGDSIGASENLENPPKMGEEEALPSQVTKDAQDQCGLERAQQEPAPPPPQGPKAACSEPSNPGSPPIQGQPQNSVPPPASPAPADTGQQLPPPRPPRSSSASVVSTSSSQAAVRSDQHWLQPPPPDLASYYYYRALYDGYQSHYPSPYPPDPGTVSLYYQDIYGLYEPRYRSYDSAAPAYADSYRYPEPERPSSRASHCSDRPSARQGYPEGYYSSKSGWSSQSDRYADCYSGQYDYGDPGRWERYHYGSRFRDPRTCDRRYWYDAAEYDPYRKESYAYGDRTERYDDPWRYDPRFTGSFDDDPEPHRDPYGEDVDRRSVHSERSAQSLRSSFSSHSRQSQVYRNHGVTAASYEAPPPPGSLPGDYAYGAYGSNFGSAQGFPEYGYPAEGGWPATEQAPSRPTSPEKFSVPHVCARFGPGGQLIKVIPNLPSEGQPALVEIHSMETLLQHTPEQEELRSFPGPLGKDDTHKVDVINFAQNKATKCLQNENLIDKESASLLWNFIVLLCRQNGTVVGTDLAELLLQDHKTVWLPGKSPNEANLIDFTNEAVEQVEEEESGEAQLSFLTDSQAASSSALEKETERFRELLLYGRKKDALESAMKNALWGHALLLASKMDSRTHARVMTRFANSLPINDPLQTVYQLMSGRMPAASTCCGDEKWGDWRPHLAMVLSNLSSNVDVESRAMATMGDTLASKGLLDAAHFCYLMAQVGLGVYTKKTTKLVLIGSNHSLPFSKFATNEAIQRTEAYEYAQSLGAQTCSFPNFQVFKFIYSCRLAEMGLATQAFHYCEVIAKSILLQPHKYSPVLISQLAQIASQLRLFDPQLREKPEEESFVEPAWLAQLHRVDKQVKEGATVWSQDGTFPQRCPSTPSSEAGHYDGPALAQPGGPGTSNPLLAPPVPSAEHFGQGVRLLPSAPSTLPASQPVVPARVPLFPVLPPEGPVELGPSCGPQGAALGFPEPSGPDPVAPYLGPGLPPGVPPLQGSEQEARTQDPGVLPPEALGRNSLLELREEGFGGKFANLGPSRMSQDSEVPPGWECASSGALQPPLTSAPEVKRPTQAARKEAKEPKKSSESWFFRWLPGKKRTEAYLPDDKNKSIVWDEKKNRWVDVNEPEEEKKAPPPPPASLPKVPLAGPPGPGGPPRASVNMFSRKAAGARARYVDVLNPGGPQRSEAAPAPAEFFAPLAPLPIPPHLFGPNADAEEAPPAEGAAGGSANPEPASEPQVFSSAATLPGPELPPAHEDSSQGGEAPSDHAPAGGVPGPAMPFYSPAPFAQASATSGGSRMGRTGQRKYPVLS